MLMPLEDGELGLAGFDRFNLLHLWSLKMGLGGAAGWERSRVIKLQMLSPSDPGYSSATLIGFAKGCTSDIIFVNKCWCFHG